MGLVLARPPQVDAFRGALDVGLVDRDEGAAGAGAIPVACRERDTATWDALRRLDHAATRTGALVEHACLQTLRGHWGSPIAAHARIDCGRLVMTAAVYAADGSAFVISHGIGSPLGPSTLGEDLGIGLLEQGAADLIAASAPVNALASHA
ncbi:hypothetical protein LO763_25555 [Glycomyces sp. A-F 0318]|uniref:hypothetical protein n=1 Tax=Glycomyces amatae TaxID=2881355 RepID=UPI001E36B7EF|nr:hypothetical protein [Glycomyces amatae]MCD0446990.1 hypothetical protein [Glycomyces amatae]